MQRPNFRFLTGQVVATRSAMEELERAGQKPEEFLDKHLSGDWGEVDAEDRERNEWAVEVGERILSAYTLRTGVKIWIITEGSRCATTLLLPSDY